MEHFYVITNGQKDPERKVAKRIQKYLLEKKVLCTLQDDEEDISE